MVCDCDAYDAPIHSGPGHAHDSVVGYVVGSNFRSIVRDPNSTTMVIMVYVDHEHKHVSVVACVVMVSLVGCLHNG